MAHAALADISFILEWDWEAAELSFKRAIELDPGYLWARQAFAMALVSQGRLDEAFAQLQSVKQRDPLALGSTKVDLGLLQLWQGDSEGAVRSWREALDLSPTHYSSLLNLGGYHCRSGEAEQGHVLLERARTLYPETPHVLAEQAACYAAAGRPIEARRLLEELEQWTLREYVDPMNLVVVHLALGQDDEVFAWLERAYEKRASLMPAIGSDPRFERLYGDARFRDLLERVGLRERASRG
jgi:Tfp pilus assembly protein PilF